MLSSVHTFGRSPPVSSLNVRTLGGAVDMVIQSLVGNERSVWQCPGCTVQYWRPNGLNACASRAHNMSSVPDFCASRMTKDLHQCGSKLHIYKSQYQIVCKANKMHAAHKCTDIITKSTSSSAIAERPLCRVGQLWPKVKECKWETTLDGHYRSVFNHYDVIGQQSNRIRWENAKKAMTPLKVIQGHRGRYQSKARMRFPISD